MLVWCSWQPWWFNSRDRDLQYTWEHIKLCLYWSVGLSVSSGTRDRKLLHLWEICDLKKKNPAALTILQDMNTWDFKQHFLLVVVMVTENCSEQNNHNFFFNVLIGLLCEKPHRDFVLWYILATSRLSCKFSLCPLSPNVFGPAEDIAVAAERIGTWRNLDETHMSSGCVEIGLTEAIVSIQTGISACMVDYLDVISCSINCCS